MGEESHLVECRAVEDEEPAIAATAGADPGEVTRRLQEVRLLPSAFGGVEEKTAWLAGWDLDVELPRGGDHARDEAAVLRLALRYALREWAVDARFVAADPCAVPADERQIWERLERVRRILDAREPGEREQAFAGLYS